MTEPWIELNHVVKEYALPDGGSVKALAVEHLGPSSRRIGGSHGAQRQR